MRSVSRSTMSLRALPPAVKAAAAAAAKARGRARSPQAADPTPTTPPIATPTADITQFRGPECRGSDRSIGRPPDRPPLDASRHQTRGGCAAGRETILRLQPVLKGIPRREESGVARDHLGRALRWVSEGREGAPVSH